MEKLSQMVKDEYGIQEKPTRVCNPQSTIHKQMQNPGKNSSSYRQHAANLSIILQRRLG